MIVLERHQIDYADKIAIQRRAFGLKQNRVQDRGLDTMPALERFMYEVIGTRAEMAAHLLFRVEWKNRFCEEVVRDGDLAGFVEVKGVARPKDRLLIKEEKAKPEHAYLLMDGTFHPAWYAIGWIWGYDALLDDYRDNFGGGQGDCFIVPRSIPPLRAVRELYDTVHQRLDQLTARDE
jgi:hypothetical protein